MYPAGLLSTTAVTTAAFAAARGRRPEAVPARPAGSRSVAPIHGLPSPVPTDRGPPGSR